MDYDGMKTQPMIFTQIATTLFTGALCFIVWILCTLLLLTVNNFKHCGSTGIKRYLKW